jgi:phosphoribosylanthranilate isomerase
MALASGISPENVDTFLPYVDAYLVARGIETAKYSGVLVPELTRQLADKIHSYKG